MFQYLCMTSVFVTENLVQILSIAAGVAIALGYVIYFFQTIRNEISPNPATWLMWAYGTILLTIVEADLNAPFWLLLLPIVCSVCGVGVALLCWRRNKMHFPKGTDAYAFFIDLILTCVYVCTWAFSEFGFLTGNQLLMATMVVLVCSNLSTIVSFIPIVRSTYSNPSHESPLPWFIWTFSYLFLGYATILAHGDDLTGSVMLLLLYPVSCFVLHGVIGLLAYRNAPVVI
jgi:hypothetical protein